MTVARESAKVASEPTMRPPPMESPPEYNDAASSISPCCMPPPKTGQNERKTSAINHAERPAFDVARLLGTTAYMAACCVYAERRATSPAITSEINHIESQRTRLETDKHSQTAYAVSTVKSNILNLKRKKCNPNISRQTNKQVNKSQRLFVTCLCCRKKSQDNKRSLPK